jgi:hypothetical protein
MSTSKLLHIATNFASSEEADGAIFHATRPRGSKMMRLLRPWPPETLRRIRRANRGDRDGRKTLLSPQQSARTPRHS